MEPVTTKTTTTVEEVPARRAAVNGLAIVGFIALVFIGITLAIYAARGIPETASRLGAANVYLSTLFGGEEDAELEVVPDEIPFEENNEEQTATSTPIEPATPTTPATPATPTTPSRPATPIVTVVPVPGTAAPLYGKADLTARLLERGYLKSADTDSFVKSSTVPDGKRPAVRFRVTNIGTNETDSWIFTAKLPTKPAYTYKSRSQQNLKPNQYADYTLGYDRPKDGDNDIIIKLDTEDDVNESNENNNSLTIEVEVED